MKLLTGKEVEGIGGRVREGQKLLTGKEIEGVCVCVGGGGLTEELK